MNAIRAEYERQGGTGRGDGWDRRGGGDGVGQAGRMGWDGGGGGGGSGTGREDGVGTDQRSGVGTGRGWGWGAGNRQEDGFRQTILCSFHVQNPGISHTLKMSKLYKMEMKRGKQNQTTNRNNKTNLTLLRVKVIMTSMGETQIDPRILTIKTTNTHWHVTDAVVFHGV